MAKLDLQITGKPIADTHFGFRDSSIKRNVFARMSAVCRKYLYREGEMCVRVVRVVDFGHSFKAVGRGAW